MLKIEFLNLKKGVIWLNRYIEGILNNNIIVLYINKDPYYLFLKCYITLMPLSTFANDNLLYRSREKIKLN